MKKYYRVKLALLAALTAIVTTFCVTYINKPDQPIEETQNVPTQVVRMQGIVLDMRPEPVTEIKSYGGIAYDFKNVNTIKTK